MDATSLKKLNLKNKRVAIIDLGTNTFNLLVAIKSDSGIQRLLSTKEGVGLGLGGINENKLSADAIERAMQTLTKFCEMSRKLNAEIIVAFGTSAVRNAVNSNQLLELAEKNLALKIQVISGKREAELIYKGVCSGYVFSEQGLIMDIGGGSTEFILAGPNGVEKAESFEIGVSRIYQLFKFSDPMTTKDCQTVIEYLEKATGDFFEGIKCAKLIGSSGSFETFYKLSHDIDLPDDQYVNMNSAFLLKGLDRIIASTQKERDENPYIIPIRKKMAPLAAIKTKWIIDKLKIKELVISPYALKEGVMSEIN